MTIRHLDPPEEWRLVTVTKVVDGDTFDGVLRRDLAETVLDCGRDRFITTRHEEQVSARVRLSRVDTPERGSIGYLEARGDLAGWLAMVTWPVVVRAYLVDTFDRLVSDVYPAGDPGDTLTAYMLGDANRGAGWPAWIGS